jgi:hypothetical protein
MDKKLVNYNNADTRYGFMIQDSDEYNTTIYPLRIQELCTGSKDPVWPRGVGCGGERYEHCKHLKKYDKEQFDCGFFIYDMDDYASTDSNFLPKKLNTNSFIDRSRISVAKYPNLQIDHSPDVNYPMDLKNQKCSLGKDQPNPIYLKINATNPSDNIEHFTQYDQYFSSINFALCCACIILCCICSSVLSLCL